MNFKARLFLLFIFLSVNTLAAAISDIKYSEPNLKHLIPTDILLSKKGYRLNLNTVKIDCANILKLGYFKSVSYTISKNINGETITFILEPNPIPRHLHIINSPLPIHHIAKQSLPENAPINWL